MRVAFAECDCDNDGFVQGRELLVMMSRLGLPIPVDVEELRRVIQKYDYDENGFIDFDEFVCIATDLHAAPSKGVPAATLATRSASHTFETRTSEMEKKEASFS